MPKPQNKVIIQHDDLKFDGKNIIIPSYYAEVIYDYLSYVDQNTLQDADKVDYFDFLEFIENIIDHKNNKGN